MEKEIFQSNYSNNTLSNPQQDSLYFDEDEPDYPNDLLCEYGDLVRALNERSLSMRRKTKLEETREYKKFRGFCSNNPELAKSYQAWVIWHYVTLTPEEFAKFEKEEEELNHKAEAEAYKAEQETHAENKPKKRTSDTMTSDTTKRVK